LGGEELVITEGIRLDEEAAIVRRKGVKEFRRLPKKALIP